MEIQIKFNTGKTIWLTGDEFAELFGKISIIEAPGNSYPYHEKYSVEDTGSSKKSKN